MHALDEATGVELWASQRTSLAIARPRTLCVSEVLADDFARTMAETGIVRMDHSKSLF